MFDLVVFVAAALKCEDREPRDLPETVVSRGRPQLLPPGKSHFITPQSSQRPQCDAQVSALNKEA